MREWRYARAAAVTAVALLAGCGYAKRTEVDAQLAQVRQEMVAGDDALSAQVQDLGSRLAAFEQELGALRNEFGTRVQRLEGAIAFNVPVYFGFDSAELREGDRPVLDRFTGIVQEYYPNAVITVEGFTDPSGSVAYNRKLGQVRADAVRDYLVTAGLDAARVRAVSYGESKDRLADPKSAGPGDAGMRNRRVALVIDYTVEGEAVATQ